MPGHDGHGAAERSARTLLEQRIRERRMTFEEFVRWAEEFAREHKEPGTLSLRHLQRLVTGHAPGSPRPATARLLERIFGDSITALLAPTSNVAPPADDRSTELRRMLHSARRVDHAVIALLHEQLDAIRRLDRQLGAVVVHDELKAKISQVTLLMSHSLAPGTREPLAALLSEMHTLAGWQTLDMGRLTQSWSHYDHSKSAAARTGSTVYESHAAAEQAFVLLDVGEEAVAVALLADTERRAEQAAPRVLRAWLAAAYGEALAVAGDRSASLRAFDRASALLPDGDTTTERPYVVLDAVHLARWRGHALARFGDIDAVDVLTDALDHLDSSFVRAETSLRVDLATALAARGEQDDARDHAERAETLAGQLGSARQGRRLQSLGEPGHLSRPPKNGRQRFAALRSGLL